MKKLGLKKSFVSLTCIAFLLVGTLIFASAFESYTITAHTIPAYSTTLYWGNNSGGIYCEYMSFYEVFGGVHTVSSGMYNVAYGDYLWDTNHFGVTVPSIAWNKTRYETYWKAYTTNHTSTPISVTDGYLSTN